VGEDHQTGVEVQQEDHNQADNGKAQSNLGQPQGFQGHAFLNGRLVGAEQRGPVEKATNDHRPDGVTCCGIGIHAAELTEIVKVLGFIWLNSLEELQAIVVGSSLKDLDGIATVEAAQAHDQHQGYSQDSSLKGFRYIFSY